MKRIQIVVLFLLLVQTTVAQQRKPNVLFIASDDLNVDMNVFDDPFVKTPNLDRLFKLGVRFDRAYCQYPLCSPSRTSLMTGLRPDKTKVKDLFTFFRDTLPDVVTLPQLFRNNGYFTGRVGKIYHYGVPAQIGTNGQDDSLSWDVRVNPIGVDKFQEKNITNYTPSVGLGGALSFWATPEGDEEHTDGKVAIEATKLLQKHQHDPFFLAVGFFRPHTPYVAPKKHFDLYPLDKIQLPEERADDWENKPIAARFTQIDHSGLSVQQRKEVTQAYYAAISFMDAQVGKLLDELDRLGLTENTIIVFWSDHGYALGQHGQWMKQTLFEHTARVPLLIAAPDLARQKRTLSSVELLDIYPTLAELAGLSIPQHVQGKSLVEILRRPELTLDKPAYTQIDKNVKQKAWYKNIDRDFLGRSVRYKQWRYTEWNEGRDGAELYNYEQDPNEFTNLVNNPDYAEILTELKRLLVAQWKRE